MSFQFLQIEDAAPARIITLHRPERRNALSAELLAELDAALTHRTARVLILASSGPVFSSGHDLGELRKAGQSECSATFELCSRLMLRLQSLSVPVIAEVQGLATAAGLQLVTACDLAIASENARFATPGVRIGLFCSTPMIPLVRAIGRKRAFEMLMTGEAISAQTALAWGLLNRVVPAAQLRSETLALATQIADASAETVATGKRLFYETVALPDETAYRTATDAMIHSARTVDAQEGISAFLEKRRPVWTRSATVDD